MKKWTEEQYQERARVMSESNAPLKGSRPGLGYFGSREHIADLTADNLYRTRKAVARLERKIREMY